MQKREDERKSSKPNEIVNEEIDHQDRQVGAKMRAHDVNPIGTTW